MIRLTKSLINSSLNKVPALINPFQQENYSISKRNTKRFFERVKKYHLKQKGPPEVNNTFISQRLDTMMVRRRWKPAYLIFKSLVERDSHPNRHVYRKLLYTIAVRGGAMPEAFKVFRRMFKKYSAKRDLVSYNLMINACALHDVGMNVDREDYLETNSLKKAMDLYVELKENKLIPNTHTYSYLFKCFYLYGKRIAKRAEKEGGESSSSTTLPYDYMTIIEDIKRQDPVILANPFVLEQLKNLNLSPQDIDPQLSEHMEKLKQRQALKNSFF